MHKKAVLLINLGTPNDCDRLSVWKYLTEFLNDPRVVDLPWLLRILLVNLVIIPLRLNKVVNAYRKIWLKVGSPLLIYSNQLKIALSNALGSDYHVELGMRYGRPGIRSALQKLDGASSLTVIPLFPQYSSAATGSALQVVLEELKNAPNIPTTVIRHDFYNDPNYIKAYAELIKDTVNEKTFDLILFSYHGLPERHLEKSHCIALCDKASACPAINASNLFCYRAQCYASTELIAKELGLASHQYAVSFQSRLGRTPWIKPYTDKLLPQLAQKGVKNIAIVSPSFVTDCLETVEEINIRTREQWQKLSSGDFIFVPCLNDSSTWIKGLTEIISQTFT